MQIGCRNPDCVLFLESWDVPGRVLRFSNLWSSFWPTLDVSMDKIDVRITKYRVYFPFPGTGDKGVAYFPISAHAITFPALEQLGLTYFIIDFHLSEMPCDH